MLRQELSLVKCDDRLIARRASVSQPGGVRFAGKAGCEPPFSPEIRMYAVGETPRAELQPCRALSAGEASKRQEKLVRKVARQCHEVQPLWQYIRTFSQLVRYGSRVLQIQSGRPHPRSESKYTRERASGHAIGISKSMEPTGQ